MKFEFSTADRIVFGPGTLSEVGSIAKEFGVRAFVILGVENEDSERLLSILWDNKIDYITFQVNQEPTVNLIQKACFEASRNECDLVIGFGGGSAIDTAKSVASLMTNPGDIFDYLEVIGNSKPLRKKGLPVIAIPTTAGTGAEVTRNAVVYSPEHCVKVSLRSPMMLPNLALIDPELTLCLPKEVTASTGLDALTQVIEPFVSNQANPITDSLCREGMARAAASLRIAYNQGDDLGARQNMCLASLVGGLALANSKLGAVHGFAGVIGGMFSGPHGIICARLLPYVFSTNVNALREREPDGEKIKRFDEVGRILTRDSSATAAEAVAWIKSLTDELVVRSLSEFGMKEADIPEVVEKSEKSSSMKGNPVALTKDELYEILQNAL